MGNKTFLLVDDNSVALEELSKTLRYLGNRSLHRASSANEAWSMLKLKDISCVFSAWEMPEMSGLALLKIVRNDDRFVKLPFFLSDTTFTKPKIIEAGRAGVSGLIVTPYTVETIKEKIEALSRMDEHETPSQEEISLDEGMSLLDEGQYEAALEVFQKLLKEGESAEVYYNIGYIKTAQGLYQEGIEAFRKATQLDRLFAKAYEAMGRAYRDLGENEKAEESLHQAAQIYMSSEKDENAEEILNEILELQPDTVNVYNSLGVLYRKRGDFETALTQYKKALKIHPEAPHIYYNIGRVYLDLNKPQKAEIHFRHALKLDPNFEESRKALNAVEQGQV